MKSLLPKPETLTTWALDESRQRLTASTGRSHLRVFPVHDPVTVFVKGTQCSINVQYHLLDQIEIHAHLYNAFGLRFVTEQDEAGVYIVVKRRWLWGRISRADFRLKVPVYANLAFNLVKGSVKVEEINGVLELPPPRQHISPTILQLAVE